jgi:hypothetical protein
MTVLNVLELIAMILAGLIIVPGVALVMYALWTRKSE